MSLKVFEFLISQIYLNKYINICIFPNFVDKFINKCLKVCIFTWFYQWSINLCIFQTGIFKIYKFMKFVSWCTYFYAVPIIHAFLCIILSNDIWNYTFIDKFINKCMNIVHFWNEKFENVYNFMQLLNLPMNV